MWKLKKNLIIEGPDLAGKSTLSEQLQKHLQFPTRGVRILRIKSPTERIAYGLADVSRNDRCILDRSHIISDTIYEPILGNGSSVFTEPMVQEQVEKVIKDNCVVIHVHATTADLVERYNQRGDDLRTLSEILSAADAYEAYFDDIVDRKAYPVLRVNSNVCPLIDVVVQMLHELGAIVWEFDTITEGAIQSVYDRIDWKHTTMGDRTSIVQAELPNGFIITESSSCLSEKNFNPKIGLDVCKARIKNKLWELEAYRLKGEN